MVGGIVLSEHDGAAQEFSGHRELTDVVREQAERMVSRVVSGVFFYDLPIDGFSLCCTTLALQLTGGSHCLIGVHAHENAVLNGL
jgi:hypothetical protein